MKLQSKPAGHFKIEDKILLSINHGIMPLPVITIQHYGKDMVDIETPRGHSHFWYFDNLLYLEKDNT